MNSKKYLSALLLTLSLAGSQALKAEDYNEYSNYSNYSLGNIVDSALEVPGAVVEGATDIVEEPVDAILGDEVVVAKPQPYSSHTEQYASDYDDDDMDDEFEEYAHEYGYNNYGALDADNIDSDYNPELE